MTHDESMSHDHDHQENETPLKKNTASAGGMVATGSYLATCTCMIIPPLRCREPSFAFVLRFFCR